MSSYNLSKYRVQTSYILSICFIAIARSSGFTNATGHFKGLGIHPTTKPTVGGFQRDVGRYRARARRETVTHSAPAVWSPYLR